MKNLLFTLLVLLGLQIQAQTPCDSLQFYGVEEDFTLYANPEVITITVSGNWEGESIILADVADNVTSVYNNNPTNMMPYESLTICQSTANTVCCEIYVWNGQVWVIEGENNESTWTCNDNAFGCTELMDGSGEFATEESCLASCDSIVYCNGYLEITEDNGQLMVSVFDMVLPVTYLWDTGETSQAISPSNYGVYAVSVTDADGCDYVTIFTYFNFDFCDSTWYDASFTEVDGLWEVTLTGYINESLNDLSDTVLHSFTVTPSNDFMSQYGSAGSYPDSWSPEFALSLTTDDTLTICWSAAVYADGLNAFPQGWSEQCNMSNEQMICDDWFWNGEAWARSTSGTAYVSDFNIKDAKLLKVIDALGRVADKDATNRLLFYIYDNGKIEKKFIVE